MFGTSKYTTKHTARTLIVIDMHARTSFVACFAVALLSANAIGVEATYKYFAGYEPLTDVTEHSKIDLDLKNIADGLGSNCGENLNDCGATTKCPTNACQYDLSLIHI